MKTQNWTEFKEFIDKGTNFLISSHLNIDGDGLGSESAIFFLLKKLGKEANIINVSPLPQEYEFLNGDTIFHTWTEETDLLKFDSLIVLDVGNFKRLGQMANAVEDLNIPVFCIDHHPEKDNRFDHRIVDTSAAATAMLIYQLLREHYPKLLDKTICDALYAGILTDTGSFKYSNTDAETLEIAADLLRYGVVPGTIHKYVYENRKPEQVKLLGYVLQNIHYELNGQIAWFSLTQAEIRSAGAKTEDVDGFTDFIRQVKGVEVSVMFMETPEKIRVNFRSKGKIVINEVAYKFNGGGHSLAAGASFVGTLEQAIESVLSEIKKLFK